MNEEKIIEALKLITLRIDTLSKRLEIAEGLLEINHNAISKLFELLKEGFKK